MGPREGLREGSKSPLPHYEPSIYGPFSHIEGEGEGKIESQLILGLDIQTVNLNQETLPIIVGGGEDSTFS